MSFEIIAVERLGVDRYLLQTGVGSVPAAGVEVVNGLGAGDAFGGALCHGWLADWDLDRIIRFFNVAGAIIASRLECSTAMPPTDEVESAMQEIG